MRILSKLILAVVLIGIIYLSGKVILGQLGLWGL